MPLDADPIHALRIRTPRVELRIPTEADIEELLAVARRGVHDPAEMPFQVAWTDTPDAEFDEQFRSYHAGVREQRGIPGWDAQFVVAARDRGGIIIGTQGATVKDGKELPETGSWLGLEFQSKGYGSEMRAAILAFLFEELGYPAVTSGAYAFNEKSLGVSRKLGYVETGREIFSPRGEPQESIRLRLDRDRYLARRPDVPVEILGAAAAHQAFPGFRGVAR